MEGTGLNAGAKNLPTTSGQLLPFERYIHSVVLPPIVTMVRELSNFRGGSGPRNPMELVENWINSSRLRFSSFRIV